ncbi:hypothetical protein [Fictibacillus sp. JL2B1089]|uniref:hypothetical protein n=1 Tax=Fictibacillus sp. JL2B1089 TaxID=3399565 RepID=UPI003A8C3C14
MRALGGRDAFSGGHTRHSGANSTFSGGNSTLSGENNPFTGERVINYKNTYRKTDSHPANNPQSS